MKKYFILFCLLGVWSMPVFAQNMGKVVEFNPVPYGLASSLVYDHWMKDPEYKDFTDFMKSPPAYMIAQADINDDGKDEIFARHSDQDLDYCPNFGEECRLHIYRVDDKGELVEIGRMYSSRNIVVLNEKIGGYHILRVERAKQHVVDYKWDGKAYKEK